MIESFGNRCAEDIYDGNNTKHSRRLPIYLHENAQDKLDMINAARELRELRVPPANQLEALKGDYKGQHSIRINKQWRIVFRWDKGHAYDVKILDYHQ